MVCTTLSTAVTLLAEWLEDIGLLLNSSKTQVLFIRPRGVQDGPSSIYCRGQVLETTHTAKYLGVIIDNELSWKQHANHVSRKAMQAIGQLWRHGRALSLRARKMWYISLVQSHLLYASNCFSPALTSQLLQQLLKVSKSGLRAIFQLPPRTPTGPLMARLSLSSILSLYKRKWLIFVFRCVNSLASDLFQHFYILMSDAAPQTADAPPVTRGQASRLLRIPFQPGMLGRRTIQARGSCLWNALPEASRLAKQVESFNLNSRLHISM